MERSSQSGARSRSRSRSRSRPEPEAEPQGPDPDLEPKQVRPDWLEQARMWQEDSREAHLDLQAFRERRVSGHEHLMDSSEWPRSPDLID